MGIVSETLISIYKGVGCFFRFFFRPLSPAKRNDSRIPETFEEALDAFVKIILDLDSKYSSPLLDKETPELFAVELHHNLGRWIRNKWGLWLDESPLKSHMKLRFGIDHPDDISSIITMCSWQRMKRLPLTPMVFANSFKDYWEEVDSKFAGGGASIRIDNYLNGSLDKVSKEKNND